VGLSLFLLTNFFSFISGINYFSFIGFIAALMLYVFFLIKSEFIVRVYKLYVRIFAITIIPSIVLFIIVVWFGVDLPHSIIKPLNLLKTYDYNQYAFLVIPNLNIVEKYRFCSFYDEPGLVGTTSAVILFSSGFNLKSKINIPILIAGLLSLSLFFYIAIIIYLFIFVRLKYKIILAVLMLSFFIITKENRVLSTLLYDRAQIENGSLVGNDRTSKDFDNWYKVFSKSNDYYFGLGRGTNLQNDPGGASYKGAIVNYGIVPISIFIGLFLLLAYFRLGFSKLFFVYTFLLLTVFYQRPFIGQFYGGFILLGSLFYMASLNRNIGQSTIVNKNKNR
jgi:hypothetical protein